MGILVIDVGTSSVRAVVVRPDGSIGVEHRCATLPDSPMAGLVEFDAAVLATEWASIVGMDWGGVKATMRSPVLIDGRNALDPLEMTRLGYVFEGIGRIPAHVEVPR